MQLLLMFGYKMSIRKKQMRKYILESFSDPGIRFYGMADVTYCLVYNFEDLKLVWGMLRLFLNKPHTVHNLSTWKTKGHSHHYHLIKTKPMNTFIQDKMRRWKKKLHRTIYHMRTLNRRHWYARCTYGLYGVYSVHVCDTQLWKKVDLRFFIGFSFMCAKISQCCDNFAWLFLFFSHLIYAVCVCQPIWRIALVKVSFRQAKCEQRGETLRW